MKREIGLWAALGLTIIFLAGVAYQDAQKTKEIANLKTDSEKKHLTELLRPNPDEFHGMANRQIIRQDGQGRWIWEQEDDDLFNAPEILSNGQYVSTRAPIPAFKAHAAVLLGKLRAIGKEGVQVQVHVPIGTAVEKIKIVSHAKGKAGRERVIDVVHLIHASDHHVFVAQVLQTDWPVCAHSDPVEVFALIGNQWVSQGTTTVTGY